MNMDGARRRPRTVGGLMVAVAIVALICLAVRPYGTPAVVREAAKLLGQHRPGFIPGEHRVESITPSADGEFLRVGFARVAGAGEPKTDVTVPARRVRAARSFPW